MITFLRKWLTRQGVREAKDICSWTWVLHDGTLLTAHEPDHPPFAGKQAIFIGQIPRERLLHIVRDQWRARNWSKFQKGTTLRSNEIPTMPWQEVSPIFDATRKHIQKIPADLRRHGLAAVSGGYISAAHFEVAGGFASNRFRTERTGQNYYSQSHDDGFPGAQDHNDLTTDPPAAVAPDISNNDQGAELGSNPSDDALSEDDDDFDFKPGSPWQPSPCPYCKGPPADKNHEWWQCPALASHRPAEARTPLQRALGWASRPTRTQHDYDTILTLALLRKMLLEHRWDRGRPGSHRSPLLLDHHADV